MSVVIEQEGGFPLTIDVITINGTTKKVVETTHHQTFAGIGDLPKHIYYNIEVLPQVIAELQRIYDENK